MLQAMNTLTSIGSAIHVKNPYIRSKLVEILYEMFPHEEDTRSSIVSNLSLLITLYMSNRFSAIFEHNKFALEHLIPALVTLYVDIETTGSTYIGLTMTHKGEINSMKSLE